MTHSVKSEVSMPLAANAMLVEESANAAPSTTADRRLRPTARAMRRRSTAVAASATDEIAIAKVGSGIAVNRCSSARRMVYSGVVVPNTGSPSL
jgi:hypothetical protein